MPIEWPHAFHADDDSGLWRHLPEPQRFMIIRRYACYWARKL